MTNEKEPNFKIIIDDKRTLAMLKKIQDRAMNTKSLMRDVSEVF